MRPTETVTSGSRLMGGSPSLATYLPPLLFLLHSIDWKMKRTERRRKSGGEGRAVLS